MQSRIGYFGQFQQGNGYGPPPPGRPQHAPGQQYQCNQDGPSLALSHPQQTFGRVQTAPMYPSAQQGMPMEARSSESRSGPRRIRKKGNVLTIYRCTTVFAISSLVLW